MSTGIRLSYEEVAACFRSQGCELLETDYKNARTKMRYRCSCGNESSIVFDSFKRGNRCRVCGGKKNSKKQSLTHDEVAEYFRSQGCELLDPYRGSRVPMRYRCSCDRESTINWNNFYSKGKRCWECGRAKIRGENHYEWREDREVVKLDYRFRHCCYKMLAYAMKQAKAGKKQGRTKSYLGYDWPDLLSHIQGYPDWPEVSKGEWHIDHIFPIKAFIDYGITDMAVINCLENLRPLPGTENIRKNAKYDRSAFERWLTSKGISFRRDI